jgi:hypothetical protein
VAGLAATVAGLSSSVQRATVGSGAVAGDVACQSQSRHLHYAVNLLTKLATSVAFHGLSLAVAGKVVRSTALVAGGRAGAASEAAPEASSSSVAATGSTSAATHSWVGWVGAVAGKVASETAAVATSASTGSAQAQSRAIRLDVSEALAVVALLGCSLVSLQIFGFTASGVWASRERRMQDNVSDCGSAKDSI